jgi:asparagine synthase (glutamine-hydrolysing)
MSLFAGVYSLSEHGRCTPPPKSATETIAATLTRFPGDTVQTHATDRFFVAYVDVGAFGEPGFRVADGKATVVAGEPLLNATADRVPSRLQDLAEIAGRLEADDAASVLNECRGTYALCHYDEAADILWLATDKVGVRPLYYHIGREHLYFSTCLRVLEGIADVPKRMDMAAIAQESTCGYPLGDRTPFADIKILLSGEAIQCAAGRPRRLHYFRMDRVEETRLSREAFLDELYERFVSAVACRANRSDTAISLLSGGLDSRCIVAVLRALGQTTSTIVFESMDNPDRRIADAYAALVGTRHHVRRLAPGRPLHELLTYQDEVFEELSESADTANRLVFSGDNGGISVGYLYVDEPLVRLMREGRTREAIEFFFRSHRLPRRLFRPEAYRRLKHAAEQGLIEELERIDTPQPEKAFYYFHMANSHRRILRLNAVEDMDLRRVEYLLPFYDGPFIELIVSAPAEWGIAHRLYHEWLSRFPPETTRIPWQTYPGHLPCPVGGLENVRTQWQPSRTKLLRANEIFLPRCRKAMMAPRFPDALFRRPVVMMAYGLHVTGIRSYGYIIRRFVNISDYYERCGGRMVFPDADVPCPPGPVRLGSPV